MAGGTDPLLRDVAIESGTTEQGIDWVIFPATNIEGDGKTMGAVFAPEGHPWRSITEDDGTIADALNASVGKAGDPNEGWYAVITVSPTDLWGDETPDPFAFMMGEVVVHWTTDLVKEKTLQLADMVAQASVSA